MEVKATVSKTARRNEEWQIESVIKNGMCTQRKLRAFAVRSMGS